jgi:ribosomal protein S18 acetylase RimI-like enzyme
MSSQQDAVIAQATAADIPSIEAIVKAAYSKYIDRMGQPPAPMLADYAELLDSQDVYVLRAAAGGEVVGSIILAVDDTERSIKINNLVVDPSAQGRGYGRALMDHAEHVARTKELSAITLYTNVMMHENIVLYKKRGFAETGRRTEGPYERVYFRKQLA